MLIFLFFFLSKIFGIAGNATYYDETQFWKPYGTCMFPANIVPTYFAALNHVQFGNAAYCGACADVHYGAQSVNVQIVDMCPDEQCIYGHLDLSQAAFSQLANPILGKIGINWDFVPCPVTGNLQYVFKTGSTQYWLGVQVRNHAVQITKLELKASGSNTWVELTRQEYNYFEKADGIAVPASVRVTAITGEVIEDNGLFTVISGDGTFASSHQFNPTFNGGTTPETPGGNETDPPASDGEIRPEFAWTLDGVTKTSLITADVKSRWPSYTATVNYTNMGITVSSDKRSITQKFHTVNQYSNQTGSQIYLLKNDKSSYEIFQFNNKEISYDVELNDMVCGMNCALYSVEMPPNGESGKGAASGSGYCDAQGGGGAAYLACGEMDIWEANRFVTQLTPHSCTSTGQSTSQMCDSPGCFLKPYRYHPSFYGPESTYTIDTTKKFTVVTQFINDSAGKLNEIRRLYVQDGVVVPTQAMTVQGVSYDSITGAYCTDIYMTGTSLEKMGDSINAGHVLTMSLWAADNANGMDWLNSGEDGPCPVNNNAASKASLIQSHPNAKVTWSNLKVGAINTTYNNNGNNNTNNNSSGNGSDSGGNDSSGGDDGDGNSSGGTGPCGPHAALSGGVVHTSVDAQGSVSGAGSYKYTLRKEAESPGNMTVYSGTAAFKAEWSISGDFLARVGLEWGTAGGVYTQYDDIVAEYQYTRSAYNTSGDYSYIGVYGWTRNPLVEFFIVDEWFGNTWTSDSQPVDNWTICDQNLGGCSEKGTFSVDGSDYKVYKTSREGYSINNITETIDQYYSVRQRQRKCGSISVTSHLKKWVSLCMPVGSMYETKVAVLSGGNTGWINYTHASVTTGVAGAGTSYGPCGSGDGGGETPPPTPCGSRTSSGVSGNWPCGLPTDSAIEKCYQDVGGSNPTACTLQCSNQHYDNTSTGPGKASETGRCTAKPCGDRRSKLSLIWPCAVDGDEETKCYQDIGGELETKCVTSCSNPKYNSTSMAAQLSGKCTLIPLTSCDERDISTSGDWPCARDGDLSKCYQDFGGDNETLCVSSCTNPHYENVSTIATTTGKCTVVPCLQRSAVLKGDWPCKVNTDVTDCLQDIGGAETTGCTEICSNPHYDSTSEAARSSGKCAIKPCNSRIKQSTVDDPCGKVLTPACYLNKSSGKCQEACGDQVANQTSGVCGAVDGTTPDSNSSMDDNSSKGNNPNDQFKLPLYVIIIIIVVVVVVVVVIVLILVVVIIKKRQGSSGSAPESKTLYPDSGILNNNEMNV